MKLIHSFIWSSETNSTSIFSRVENYLFEGLDEVKLQVGRG